MQSVTQQARSDFLLLLQVSEQFFIIVSSEKKWGKFEQQSDNLTSFGGSAQPGSSGRFFPFPGSPGAVLLGAWAETLREN